MHFHHLHFYVRDAAFWQAWFIRKLAFQPGPTMAYDALPHPTVLQQEKIEIRLSGSEPSSGTADAEVRRYLQQHPPGLVDVAFASDHFDQVLARAQQQGAQRLKEVTLNAAGQRQCQIQGWADLRHTLVEVSSEWASDRQQNCAQSDAWLCANRPCCAQRSSR